MAVVSFRSRSLYPTRKRVPSSHWIWGRVSLRTETERQTDREATKTLKLLTPRRRNDLQNIKMQHVQLTSNTTSRLILHSRSNGRFDSDRKRRVLSSGHLALKLRSVPS